MTEENGYPIPGALLISVLIGLFLWLALAYWLFH